jgi:hypothetical protein
MTNMRDPWEPLADELLPMLEESVRDFLDILSPEVEYFLQEKARQLAKAAWLAHLSPVEAIRKEAKQNLAHTKTQVATEAREKSVASRAEDIRLLKKVFEVFSCFLLQHGAQISIRKAAV